MCKKVFCCLIVGSYTAVSFKVEKPRWCSFCAVIVSETGGTRVGSPVGIHRTSVAGQWPNWGIFRRGSSLATCRWCLYRELGSTRNTWQALVFLTDIFFSHLCNNSKALSSRIWRRWLVCWSGKSLNILPKWLATGLG